MVDVVNQQTSNAPVEELQTDKVLGGERKGENVQQNKKVEPKPSVHKEKNIQPKVLKERGPEKRENRKSKKETGDVQELTQQKKPVQPRRVGV